MRVLKRLAISILCVTLLAVPGCAESEEQSLDTSFPVGTSFEDVVERLGDNYVKEEAGVAYLSEPTAEQKENDAIYIISYEEYGVAYEFNHHDRLIASYEE